LKSLNSFPTGLSVISGHKAERRLEPPPSIVMIEPVV
jgi:hypothetical protein